MRGVPTCIGSPVLILELEVDLPKPIQVNCCGICTSQIDHCGGMHMSNEECIACIHPWEDAHSEHEKWKSGILTIKYTKSQPGNSQYS